MRVRPGPRALSLRGVATVAGAFGAVAVGAFAIGAATVRRLAIGSVRIGRAEFGSLDVHDLAVKRFRVGWPDQPSELITKTSVHPPAETMERLEGAIRDEGITVFARIDHSGEAAARGMPLRFTQVLIFGNPKAGTPLMQSCQTIGIDLPLKVLVWQDEGGDVRVGYQDPAAVAARHGVTDRADVVAALSKVLAGLAESVT